MTDLRPLAGLDAGARVVLYQGGYAPGRGLEVLIQAAPSLPDGAHLVLLGDGRYRAELEQLVEAYDIGDRVHFVEAVPPAELLSVTASATVGVVPYQPVSMNNRLALPNKIFEYVAAGLPVVASDVPEMRRIVQESGAGALYDPYSPASLSEAMNRVLDESHYEAFRTQATAYGETNCWENEQRVLIEAYRRIKPNWPAVDVRDRQDIAVDSPSFRLTG